MRDLARYSKAYSELNFETEMEHYRRKVVLERIANYASTSILEIGCGMKPLFLNLPDVTDVTVIEPTEKFYYNAQTLSREFLNVKVIKSTLENSTIERQFDLIIVSSLLHEISDQSKFLNKLHKLCKENTIVHFNVPNARSLHRRVAVSLRLISSIYEISKTQKKMQQLNTPFDQGTFTKLLRDHEFDVVSTGSYFLKPLTHAQMYKLAKIGVANNKVLDHLFDLGKKFPDYASEIWADCKISPNQKHPL